MNKRKRNIQFRGKRIEDNKWIYGYLASKNFINNINEIATPSEEVYPETVGQFTEVYDINNTPIFEGDIVETFTISLAYRQIGNYPPPNIEVEEYEIERSVNVVEFSYGSFNINGYLIMFEDMMTEEDEEYDIKFDPDRKEFEEMLEDNSYNIRDKYPYLTWNYFKKPHVIGNIFDNPELLEQ